MFGRNSIMLILALAVMLVSNSLYVIKETERAVMLKFGEVVQADIAPGLHVKIPFVNSVRKFEGRILTVDSQPERFFTKEQKALIVDSYAKYRVLDTAKFYTATNGEEARATGLLAQRINNGLRNQVAKRTVSQVVSGERDQLLIDLMAELGTVAETELGVHLVDVRVKKIDLPPDVSESVYERMNAEREKEAREHRSEGRELAEGIQAAADREVTVIVPKPTGMPSKFAVTATPRPPVPMPMLSTRTRSSTPLPGVCAPIRMPSRTTETFCYCNPTVSFSAT